jgi:steroid delta-isomerase-like uncharacterized protein
MIPMPPPSCASTDSAELVQLYYETFNRGDREALLRLLHPSIVHEINQGATESGIDAFRAFLKRMDHSYVEQVEDLVVLTHPNGSRAAAEFFIRGRYLTTDKDLPPATGQTYHLRVGAFFDILEGRIARVTNYYNLTDWLRQIQ